MKDAEGRFLDRIYADGIEAVGTAVEEGITAEHFADPDLGKVWAYLADYADQHQMLPSVQDVCFETGAEWEPYEPEDSLLRLIDLLRQQRSYGLYKEALAKANKVAPYKPAEAWAIVNQGYEEASADKGAVLKPTNVHDNWSEWFDTYLADEEMVGIPTGFPTMDYATGGLQPEQLVTVIGVPKAGKSTLLLKMAHYINVVQGRRVYFATFEMSAEEQRRRLACMIAEVDFERFLQKRLSPLEVRRMGKVLSQLQDVMPDFHFGSDITAGSTVGALTAQVRKFDPHVVIVDGVYLMDSEVKDAHGMDPKALTTLTRNLKRMAQRLQKPVVISHQALESRYSGRVGLRTKDIGYCVDPETEILTSNGWRMHGEVDVGDEVLTLNHDTGLSEWQPVLAMNRFEGTFDMVRMAGKTHSSFTTTNHRWPVETRTRSGRERRWVTSGEFRSRDYMIYAAPHADLPTEAKYTDAFVELVGWCWTEGHVNGPYGNFGITQSSEVNPENVARIRAALRGCFGGPWEGAERPPQKDGVPRWRESRRGRNAEFWLNVHAGRLVLDVMDDKAVDYGFLRSLTAAQLRLFIETSMLGDNDGLRSLAQKRREAAEAFQFACTLAGIPTALNARSPSASCPYTMWQVRMKTRSYGNPSAAAKQKRRFTVEHCEYTGTVWCPTTANATWLARRDGRVYFTGNSSSFAQDSDVIFGIEPTENSMERKMSIMAARNAAKRQTMLAWDWETSTMEEIEGYSDVDLDELDDEPMVDDDAA